jgi:8-oxo-dGTP pyrophosphatase MutT (NUDIX family)
MEREFTVAVFVVHRGRVLLHWHRRLARWLPPGGHVDPGELPDEAAVRETREETGLAIELLDANGGPATGIPRSTDAGSDTDVMTQPERAEAGTPGPRRLVQPLGIQLEDIGPGHQHIDLLYLARPSRPATGAPSAEEHTLRAEATNPSGRPGWFTPAEWRALPVTAEIDRWATMAVNAAARLGPA